MTQWRIGRVGARQRERQALDAKQEWENNWKGNLEARRKQTFWNKKEKNKTKGNGIHRAKKLDVIIEYEIKW